MKKYLKKTNRGIIATALVVFILTTYISSDYIRFMGQKDDIKNLVTNYLTESLDLNTSLKDFSEDEKKLITEHIDKYWGIDETSKEYYETKSYLIASVDKLFKIKPKNSLITDVKSAITKIKVKKSRPNYAIVTALVNFSVTGKDTSFILKYDDFCTITDQTPISSLNNSDSLLNKTPDKRDYHFSEETECTIKLKKIDGQWKIISIGENYNQIMSNDYE
ncbi:MAG: hypothetical protein IKN54_08275 [Lachnospiraceae bacterium]|nr:hypothetical protein [Lachnospiraceae bacterium]